MISIVMVYNDDIQKPNTKGAIFLQTMNVYVSNRQCNIIEYQSHILEMN